MRQEIDDLVAGKVWDARLFDGVVQITRENQK